MVQTLDRSQNGTMAPFDSNNINQNSVLLTLRMTKPGNRRKVNTAVVEVDADKEALSVAKELLDSEELQQVLKHEGQIRQWLYARSLPAYGALKAGVYRLPLSLVDEVDVQLQAYEIERQAWIEKFLLVYPAKIQEAKLKLRSLFDPGDYPNTATMRQAFGFEYRYLVLGVPENLSAALIHREEAKAQATVLSEIEEIKLALRTSFADLISHAADRLRTETDGKGNVKKVVFRDSLIHNMEEFMRYFQDRNIVNDQALAHLVERARTVLHNISPEDLRTNDQVRASVQQSMAQIKRAITDGAMLRPTRKLVEN